MEDCMYADLESSGAAWSCMSCVLASTCIGAGVYAYGYGMHHRYRVITAPLIQGIFSRSVKRLGKWLDY